MSQRQILKDIEILDLKVQGLSLIQFECNRCLANNFFLPKIENNFCSVCKSSFMMSSRLNYLLSGTLYCRENGLKHCIFSRKAARELIGISPKALLEKETSENNKFNSEVFLDDFIKKLENFIFEVEIETTEKKFTNVKKILKRNENHPDKTLTSCLNDSNKFSSVFMDSLDN